MEFITTGHRHGDYLFSTLPEYQPLWDEIQESLTAITEEEIICAFEAETSKHKSISHVLNKLIYKEMTSRDWADESSIFADEAYSAEKTGIWRVDFAKTLPSQPEGGLSIEVAFNHRSDIAWNLLKPTLASELNHVEKAIQTAGGVIITATDAMKAAGGFDSACGSYELYVQYLKPLRTLLSAPMVIVGLLPPRTFRIEHSTIRNPETGRRQSLGHIVRL